MTKPSLPRRVGSRARIEAEIVRKLFEESGLSKADFAALAGASVRRMPSGGYSSNTVTQWIRVGPTPGKTPGKRLMAAETYELLVTRLWLLKEMHASFDELVNQPLKEILVKLME